MRKMRAYLITGNPGSGKSTLAAELSRRGLAAVDADDLAFWQDSAGVRVAQPPDADDNWLLAHRWVWSRSRIEQRIAAPRSRGRALLFCGIARNQAEMVDLFEQVFLLMIDEQTQLARLRGSARPGSPVRAEAVRQQIRDGREVFQAQMLALGAVPLDETASPKVIADILLAHLHHSN
jgi:adenylate kinase family enzyme